MEKFQKLSRAEMKNVLGGKGVGVSCTLLLNTGGNISTPMYSTQCSDLDSCQKLADQACDMSNKCDDAICKYT